MTKKPYETPKLMRLVRVSFSRVDPIHEAGSLVERVPPEAVRPASGFHRPKKGTTGEAGPVAPVDPVGPVDPVDPTAPVEPVEPVDPEVPVAPVEPSPPLARLAAG